MTVKEYNDVLYSIVHGMCRNAHAKVLSLLTSNPPLRATDNLDESRKLCSSKTKNNLAQANKSPDSLFRCKLDSDRSEVGLNNFHVGNHITTVREHRRQSCNCRTSFLAAYGTDSTSKLNRSPPGTNLLYH